MISLLGRLSPSPSPSASKDGASTSAARFPTPIRVRRPAMAIMSVTIVFASVAGFASMYSSANRQAPVVIVTRLVPEGQRITRADLGEANAAISGSVTPIPVADASLVTGKRAAVTLPPGSLLTMADVSTSLQIQAGNAVVGVALKDGQLPTSGLDPGENVMVVETASPGESVTSVATPTPTSSSSSPTGTPGSPVGVLVPIASVYDVETPAANSGASATELVSIQISSILAPAVSMAAAAGQVSLVLLPQGDVS